MCGIAGFCLDMKDRSIRDRARLTGALLKAIESRGRDATGMAWWDTRDADGLIRVRKAPQTATRYVASGRVAQAMRPSVRTAILHTRMATQGAPEVNGNNHPIIYRPVVGVHNGHITNDDALFTRMGADRYAEVDSEAIFAMLATDPAPVTELLPQVRGRAAVAWLDKRDITDKHVGPTLHLARLDGSPLTVAQTDGGSFLFASTTALLHAACAKAGIDSLAWELELEEGDYMRVRRGVVVAYEGFTLPDPQPYFSRAAGPYSWDRS